MKRPARVLIVDDRDIVRMTIKGILFGYDCAFEEAGTGTAALELMASRQFDVVFLDLKLPDMAGLEVLTEARQRQYDFGEPIILTGLPEPATQSAAMRLGAKYLTKTPMNREQIRAAFADAVPGAIAVLPATEVQENVDEARQKRQPRASRRKLDRLLVLDDNENWLDIMRDVLGDDFDLVLTTSANEAIKRIRKEAFALVVLDMKLPGTSGLDVLNQMRKSAPDLRAIILTEHPDLTLANESGRLGALDYVKKDRNTLAGTVTEILRKNTQSLRIFFAYDRRDQEKVIDYYWRLIKRGFLPWMDVMNIIGGKKWEPQISRAIEHSDRFVFFLSQKSSNKEGIMRGEVNYALKIQDRKRKHSTFVIPARLEECEIEEDLHEFQTVDLFKRDGFARLLEALTSD